MSISNSKEFKNYINAYKKQEECKKTKCKSEVDNVLKNKSLITKKLLEAYKNKSINKQYEEKQFRKMFDSKEIDKLLDCTINKCYDDTVKVLKNRKQLTKIQCETNKSKFNCNELRLLETMLAKVKITSNDYSNYYKSITK